ncbi:hypothetical protein DV702_14555 [Sporosarcina sp. PTS2304]|uniref:hypothetical protein n=1 Tax=Sporosarcina sp. PTS2304 TaxID=2283194 RepID=UPI000E0DF29F|nr:hypothetical protein [Sporosarcina sp. PTS2304]AXI00819.1 hypothetical protein DV702_14555 [Sporosarcina sp. PTS2304]
MKKVCIILFMGLLLVLAACTEESSENPAEITDGVEIPAIQLPAQTTTADMVGLIVYNGKIYTQTSAVIRAQEAKALLGDKLGTTKGTIDEWSAQEEFAKELASTIGEMDVYSVKGYDKNFRIMAYQEQNNIPYAEFYEHLNGITIRSGEDIFGKLHLVGNVASARWRTFSERDHDMDRYHKISDEKTVNAFLEELKDTKPFPRKQQSDPLNMSRNDEEFRELTLQLLDGSTVTLIVLKGGYIYYGLTDVYFEMNEQVFSEIWNQLK